MNTGKKNIAVFASGSGTNAANILAVQAAKQKNQEEFFYNVSVIACNKPGAGVLKIAEQNGVPSLIIEKEKFFRGDAYVPELASFNIDIIVLAGFLWKVPSLLINHYPKKIINIHPALLPKYGGKGMYGHHVHEAVIKAGEKESGITIHYVDEIYDHGQTILQATCPVLPDDTADSLAKRIHQLEYRHYPSAIDLVCSAGN